SRTSDHLAKPRGSQAVAVDEAGGAMQRGSSSALSTDPPRTGLSIPSDATAPVFASGPGARGRILATAMRLFYYEGIRSVGIDRLIAESSVTKATFYKHFGSKDALILTYMQCVH